MYPHKGRFESGDVEIYLYEACIHTRAGSKAGVGGDVSIRNMYPHKGRFESGGRVRHIYTKHVSTQEQLRERSGEMYLYEACIHTRASRVGVARCIYTKHVSTQGQVREREW
jgi:hypothetical protein